MSSLRTLWTAAPVERVLGRGDDASASTSEPVVGARGDEADETFEATGAPRVGRVDAWRELGFTSAKEMREQRGSDFHRHNQRRARNGRAPVTESEFAALVEAGGDDVSSISGSDADSEEEDDTDAKSVGFRAVHGAGEGAQVVVQGTDGVTYAVWRCLMGPESRRGDGGGFDSREALAAFAAATATRPGTAAAPKPWIVLLARGGHFAASVFDPVKLATRRAMGDDGDDGDGDGAAARRRSDPNQAFQALVPSSAATLRKTFHRYVVRAKAGGRQSSKDSGGKTIKSVGSSLRRANELALEKEIRETLRDAATWKRAVESCGFLFLSVSRTDERTLFSGEDAPLRKDDRRIRRVPFATRRPTFDETRRVMGKLVAVNFDVVPSAGAEETEEDREAPETDPEPPERRRPGSAPGRALAPPGSAAAERDRETRAAAAADSAADSAAAAAVSADAPREAGRETLSKKEKERLKKQRAKARARASEVAGSSTASDSEISADPKKPTKEPLEASKSVAAGNAGKAGKAAALLAKAKQGRDEKRNEAVSTGRARRRTFLVVFFGFYFWVPTPRERVPPFFFFFQRGFFFFFFFFFSYRRGLFFI
jgi:hypothetical protein